MERREFLRHAAAGAVAAATGRLPAALAGEAAPERRNERPAMRYARLGRSRQRLLDALLPTENKIVLYYRQRFGFFTPYEHQELLLTLRDGARRKLLGKTRRLRRAQLAPPDLPWRTP